MKNNVLSSLLFVLCAAGCDKPKENTAPKLPFAATPVTAPITPGIADEASGIADSKTTPNAMWVQEDGGNPTRVQLVKHDGSLLKKVALKNVQNRDWEDMALAPGPDASQAYLYLADIGDNNQQYSSCFIYRFAEPAATTDTVFSIDKISFTYPDGAHDAEAILVDPLIKDIYIITKRDAAARIYKIPYPQSTTSTTQATFVTTLSFTGVVSAAFSANGKEVLIKTYSAVYYWQKDTSETLETTLKKAPVQLGYQMEPQGEAICFKGDNSGFFTLSEKGLAAAVSLHFYKRL